MRHLIQATTVCLALATAAHADLVYQGRDAQGLHCAAMLLVVGAALAELGAISQSEGGKGALGAALIMQQLPGSQADKLQAVRQRAAKIMATRTTFQMFDEFSATSRWCKREFLSQ